jgi:hypothetical protein
MVARPLHQATENQQGLTRNPAVSRIRLTDSEVVCPRMGKIAVIGPNFCRLSPAALLGPFGPRPKHGNAFREMLVELGAVIDCKDRTLSQSSRSAHA